MTLMSGMQEVVDTKMEPASSYVQVDHTVEEALASLRKRSFKNEVLYFYAVDSEMGLKGVVSTRELLLSNCDTKISSIMHTPVVHMKAGQTLKEAVSLFALHPLLALPVVGESGKLLGMVTAHSLVGEKLDPLSARSRYECFQLIGMTAEDGRLASLPKRYKARMPWLLCNVFSGLVCALISAFYGKVLAKYLLLAFFIPLVLTLSESASMQSMTQTLQFLRRPRFNWKIAIRRGKREWLLSWAIAISCGVLVGGISIFWGDEIIASLTIGFGILVSVGLSALFGMLIPVFLSRMRLDPKVASGPVVLMIADMLTTAVYLSLGSWWLLF